MTTQNTNPKCTSDKPNSCKVCADNIFNKTQPPFFLSVHSYEVKGPKIFNIKTGRIESHVYSFHCLLYLVYLTCIKLNSMKKQVSTKRLQAITTDIRDGRFRHSCMGHILRQLKFLGTYIFVCLCIKYYQLYVSCTEKMQ